VRDDAAAGLQLGPQSGHEPDVQGLQQVERDDGGVPDRNGRIEDVAQDELDTVGDVGRAGVPLALAHEHRIDLDADRPRATTGGGNDDLSIAATQVVHHVVGSDGCQVEHAFDDRIRRRHPVNVRWMGRQVLRAWPGPDRAGQVQGGADGDENQQRARESHGGRRPGRQRGGTVQK